jgi:hypothetical protein
MPEPLTGLALFTAACAVVGAVKQICEAIYKFFERIGDWHLSRQFKKVGMLVRHYRQNGWLTYARMHFPELFFPSPLPLILSRDFNFSFLLLDRKTRPPTRYAKCERSKLEGETAGTGSV